MSELRIVYEDENLVVVDKPSGMLVDAVVKDTDGILVHRLDRDTSGVMVLAKTESTAAILKKQFEERQVAKKYLALVHGEMKAEKGLITTPLQRYPKDQLRSAITEWRVAERIGSYTLVELSPHTGRTHQLRIHLKSIGHPIVSDPIYGFRKKIKSDLSFCPRLFLHAAYLEFTHPTNGKKASFKSDLPLQLQSVVENLLH